MSSLICNVCKKKCVSLRSLTMHLHHNPRCDVNQHDTILTPICPEVDFNIFENFAENDSNIFHNDDFFIDTNDNNNDNEIDIMEPNLDNSLMIMKYDFIRSFVGNNFIDQNIFNAQLDLIHLLDSTHTPLYLYDKIIHWINKYIIYNTAFTSGSSGRNIFASREQALLQIKLRTNMTLIEPRNCRIELPGSKMTIDIVLHDFKSCLYTLLMDENLMKEDNLLISENKVGKNNNLQKKSSVLNDIDSGDAYKIGMITYLSDNESDVLLPIIFFIDKTHTDVNGRLCLEQVRFTLGIFNRETRNNVQAWRTLGYINDQQHLPCTNAAEKALDYHFMLKTILKSFVEVQTNSIFWKIKKSNNTDYYNVVFKLAVLFIIGDTEGHDKLCGKYINRSFHVKRLCRYCNTPTEESDNTSFKFQHNNSKQVNCLINKATKSTSNVNKQDALEKLKSMSFHAVENAWENVNFCDARRGIFGATPAEVMHCLQHGLFLYLFQGIFHQRKLNKSAKKRMLKDPPNSNPSLTTINNKRFKKNYTSQPIIDDENSESDNDVPGDSYQETDFSNLKLFSELYAKRFNRICKQYGKILTWQSDRELPRTHFSSNYTMVTRKNANEMVGLLIVYLMIFASEEGIRIDSELGERTTADYIHLIELMLMMEHFCKYHEHKRSLVLLFKNLVPIILDKFKSVVNRKEGNGMKITKFHLPLHFADDIIRFGSMSNYDSGICEAHHKSEAKKPSTNTQRRQSSFEIQTAKRQIESLSIKVAYQQNFNDEQIQLDIETIQNKSYKIKFCGKLRVLLSLNKNGTKWQPINFFDNRFYNQLTVFCINMIDGGYLNSPIKFFTVHKRYGKMFKADPIYKESECWYDWATVKWDIETLPAKMLLFVDLDHDTFIKPFPIGSTIVTEPGSYALCYSLNYKAKIPAHMTSYLVSYGKIMVEENNQNPALCMFLLEAIENTVSAVPFNTSNDIDIINSIEWLFLCAKSEWYDVFKDFIKNNR